MAPLERYDIPENIQRLYPNFLSTDQRPGGSLPTWLNEGKSRALFQLLARKKNRGEEKPTGGDCATIYIYIFVRLNWT